MATQSSPALAGYMHLGMRITAEPQDTSAVDSPCGSVQCSGCLPVAQLRYVTSIFSSAVGPLWSSGRRCSLTAHSTCESKSDLRLHCLSGSASSDNPASDGRDEQDNIPLLRFSLCHSSAYNPRTSDGRCPLSCWHYEVHPSCSRRTEYEEGTALLKVAASFHFGQSSSRNNMNLKVLYIESLNAHCARQYY